jgi:hypothetical protein
MFIFMVSSLSLLGLALVFLFIAYALALARSSASVDRHIERMFENWKQPTWKVK